jgi:hypothetical protein
MVKWELKSGERIDPGALGSDVPTGQMCGSAIALPVFDVFPAVAAVEYDEPAGKSFQTIVDPDVRISGKQEHVDGHGLGR